MHRSVALKLNEVNAGFYRQEAASFSATRQGSWPGWGRCLRDAAPILCHAPSDEFRSAGRPPAAVMPASLRVLDVACGNLRFARFLARQLEPRHAVEYLAVDNNAQLARGFVVPEGWGLRFDEKDLVAELLHADSGGDDASPRSRARVLTELAREEAEPEEQGTFGSGSRRHETAFGELSHGARPLSPHRSSSGIDDSNVPADLTVCFGFLHHVPTFEARSELLGRLLAATRHGGVCCVSFWRFMSDPGLAAKARESTDLGLLDLGLTRADLDEGDFLLGWQNRPGVYRYCHSFSDGEVDRLLATAGGRVRLLDRFRSDGRSGALNEYLVLQR